MVLHTAIYRLAISAYSLLIKIAANFNAKAALFANGRKNLLKKIKTTLADKNAPRIWMHCASLGEFEQGRPVLEALKQKYPSHEIVLTFFSPSGYEVRKNYKGADYVFYLPMDSKHNATAFLNLVQPALCIFVKYEFWYYYLSIMAERKIPAILISAIFHENHPFFKPYGQLHRAMLKSFQHIFVQDAHSLQLLQNINITSASISGDTRFDRVIEAVKNKEELARAKEFANGYKILVAGSTWKEDEIFLEKVLQGLPRDWKMIVVPHEVGISHIKDIEKLFAGRCVRWTDEYGDLSMRVLLVNQVGLLMSLYQYGTIAWIGGGFGKAGVHNVLEAAVYGMPCFYGPIFHQFIEAKELIEAGGAYTYKKPEDLLKFINTIDETNNLSTSVFAAKNYVLSKGGATRSIVKYLEQNNFN